MRNISITKKGVAKAALVAAGICVACCAVPMAAIVAALGAIAATGWMVYGAEVAFVVLAVALVIGGIVLAKRRAASCRIDCGCKSSSA